MAHSNHASGESYTDHELSDPTLIRINRPNLGMVDHPEEEESTSQPNQADGGTSTPSRKSEASHTESNTPDDRKPAPTTESHSKQSPEEGSSVDSTGGDGQTTPRKRSSRARKPTGAAVRSTDDDEFDDEF